MARDLAEPPRDLPGDLPGDLPPALRRVERLVGALTAPSPHAASILGDLREGFARRAARSPLAARRWYRRQAASLAWHYLPALPGHAWRAWRASPRRPVARRHHAGDPPVIALGSDLRHAARALRRRPAVAAVLLLTLALGTGANAAIFGVVRGVLLRPLPYPDPDGVVTVWTTNLARDWTRGQASRQDAADWAAETRAAFSALGTYTALEANAVVGGESERVRVALADAATFAALGVPPRLGRGLGRGDDAAGAPPVAVVSHAFWARALGADPAAPGRAVTVDGKPLTVVGVMPPGFDFPDAATAIWRPFGAPPEATGRRGARWVSVVARLRPGVTAAAAEARLAAVAARLARAYPESNRGFGVRVEPRLRAETGDVRPLLLLAWAMVGLVLAIVGANGASLLLARAAEREGEVAVRAALGARRAALARQLLAESVLLALLGGALGAALAAAALPPLRRLAAAAGVPRAESLALDGWVLAYSVAASLAIGVLFGLAPALGAARARPADALRRAGRGAVARARVRGALTVAQVALAAVVLVAAGLLVRSFERLSRVEPGVALDGRVTFRVAPDWGTYPERAQAEALYGALLARLAATPGITAAAAVNRLPLLGSWWWTSYEPEGKPAEPGREPMGGYRVVTPGYFAAAGVALLRGRDLAAADRAGALPVTVVSRALAERAWPGEDPVGKRIAFDRRAPGAPVYTVVGVAADVRTSGLAEAPEPLAYVTLGQATFGHFGDWGMDVVVRTSLGADAAVAAARRALRAVAPAVPAFEARPLADLVARDLARRRLLVRLLGAFAATAALLAGCGLYGVVAYGVARRRREFGVRMALGARGAVVGRAVVGRSLALALAGLAVGLPAAAAGGRLLDALLYATAPRDPATFAAVGAALLAVAGLAAWAPARRAARADPAAALRAE